MKIYAEKDYQKMSLRAASIIAAEVIRNPSCVLGLATGSSPEGTYRELIRLHQEGLVTFRDVQTVNLDEYYGLSPEHEQSYRYFMQKHFFDHVDIVPENTSVPDGLAEDPAQECETYDMSIDLMGGIDLQLLGVGRNGHIGFNEPGDCFIRDPHLVDLTEGTIEANARFFEKKEDVPKQALTMGIGNIMSAGRVLLIASGQEKAQALYDMVCGPITPRCPASILQLHPDVVVVADEAALSLLKDSGVQMEESFV